MGATGRALSLLPGLVLLLPVVAGLAATLLAAFGVLPAIGDAVPSVSAWRALFGWPGFSGSLWLTLRVATAATLLSLLTASALAAAAARTARLLAVQAVAVPLLAVPHVAVAVGLAFLIAPGGWLVRLGSPWLTGWTVPPDIATVHDRWGAALVLGLWLKETPYLLLMLLAAASQTGAARLLRAGAVLGYAPWRTWTLLVLPPLWRQVRAPVLAVLAFSLSAVDMAVVLGPGTPPTLAVQTVRWTNAPDFSGWLPAAAASVLLSLLVFLGAALLLGGARLLGWLGLRVLRGGGRGRARRLPDAAAGTALALLGAVGAGAVVVLVLWAAAGRWPFPDRLPSGWGTTEAFAGLGDAVANTLLLGVVTTALGLLLAVGALHRGRAGRWSGAVLYAPLLVPQVAFLFGMQALLVRLRLDGGWVALVWAHLLFVLPYVLLALDGPFASQDRRLARSAAVLGAGPWRVLLRVTLPVLARPILAAAAVGFAVSVSLYLPTLFAGAGRIDTLATEAVALSSGADRRVLAATALVQALLPLLAYAGAVLLPAALARRRRGLAIAA